MLALLSSHRFVFPWQFVLTIMGNGNLRRSATQAPTAPALIFGFGGLVPFVGLTAWVFLGSASFWDGGKLTLAQYGAVILSFVGALHWGYAVRDDAQKTDAWLRYGWSVLPALLAWVSLRLETADALRLQTVVLIVCLLVDQQLARRLSLPSWLMQLRCWLTAVASACLLLTSFS